MSAKHQAKDATVLVVDLITTDKDKKFAPAGRMATAIIEITEQKGGCLPQDLNERGFTPTEVAQHWHMAHSLAAVEMRLMGKTSINSNSFLRRT